MKPLRGLLLTLVTVLVIGALLWFGDARKVLAEIGTFDPVYVFWFLLCLLAHEIVRGLSWHYLVRGLAPRAPIRAQVFAFAGGEAIKFMPTGVYLQNYLLQRSAETPFGLSSAATTVMIVAEIAAALLGVILMGAGSWSAWMGLATILLICFVFSLGRAAYQSPHVRSAPRWLREHPLLRRALESFRRFRIGAALLADPRLLLGTLALSIGYVWLAGVDLYLVVRGLGIGDVSLWQAVGVNCFGLAFYVVLGSLEAADLGAFLAIGVSKSAAVSAILINRGLSVAGTLLFALFTLALLRDQWRPVRDATPHAEAASSDQPLPA